MGWVKAYWTPAWVTWRMGLEVELMELTETESSGREPIKKKRSSYGPSCCNASSTTLGGSVDPFRSSVHSLNKTANGHGGRSITPTPWQCCFARSWSSWSSLRPRVWSQAGWACWWQRQWCRTALPNSGVLSPQTWHWDWSGCIGKEREREGGWEYNPADGQIPPAVGGIMIAFPEYAGTTSAECHNQSFTGFQQHESLWEQPKYPDIQRTCIKHTTLYILCVKQDLLCILHYTLHSICITLYASHTVFYILWILNSIHCILNIMHSNYVL